MKNFKRIAAAAIAVIMTFAMCISTLAAEITVTGGVDGQEYKAYLIFNLETATTSDNKTAYIYTIDDDSEFLAAVKAYCTLYGTMELVDTTRDDGSGNTIDCYEVQISSSFDASHFAAFLKAEVENPQYISGSYTAVAEDTASTPSGGTTSATLSSNVTGYYFINTNVGTLAILQSVSTSLSIVEKNATPTVDKTVDDDADDDTDTDNDTAQIGDTVYYTLDVTVGDGYTAYAATDSYGNITYTYYNYVIKDTLSSGLTFDADDLAALTVVDSDGNTWIKDTDYTASYEVQNDSTTILTITLIASSDNFKALDKTDVVSINYTATLNENAVVGSAGNENTVVLTYGKDSDTSTSSEEVYTYRFGLEKTSDLGQLAGAVFSVTDSTGNKLYFIRTTGPDSKNSYYRVTTNVSETVDLDLYDDSGTERVIGSDGQNEKYTASQTITTTTTNEIVYFVGLDAGTYTLTEEDAPNGYNKLTSTIKVTISETGAVSFSYSGSDSSLVTPTTLDYVQIKNNTGSTLPETGGMGTKIFYTIGGILVVGAGILLITKRRMNSGK